MLNISLKNIQWSFPKEWHSFYGYDNYGEEIRIIINNITYIIFFPNYKNINEDNLKYAHNGEYALGIKKDYGQDIIYSTYNYNELWDKIKELVEVK